MRSARDRSLRGGRGIEMGGHPNARRQQMARSLTQLECPDGGKSSNGCQAAILRVDGGDSLQ
jgi:hypothetical protein